MQEKAHWIALNSTPTAACLISYCIRISLTSWISGLRRPVDQNPHTASTESEANLHLRFFPRNNLVPYPPRI